jgi:hypothetical protein
VACRGEQSYAFEDLVFSMMAHIGHDLPYALAAVQADAGRLADFHRMNDIMGSQTERIQKVVAQRYESFLFVLDKLTGNFDEFLTN